MNLAVFLEFKLKFGDNIYIIDEKGEGWKGLYQNGYNPYKHTFTFHNFSKGKPQTVEVLKLQRLDINRRA